MHRAGAKTRLPEVGTLLAPVEVEVVVVSQQQGVGECRVPGEYGWVRAVGAEACSIAQHRVGQEEERWGS